MAKGDPQIVPDMNLAGDAAMWQQVEYYIANRNDHAYMWDKDVLRGNIEFLYRMAKQNQSRRLDMLERRLQQMAGSHSDDPVYYVNACNQALRALEIPEQLLRPVKS